jgi:hypothetical protein
MRRALDTPRWSREGVVSNGGWAQAGRTAILTVVILIVVVIAGSALVEALVQSGASNATNVHVFAGEKSFTTDLTGGKVTSVKADLTNQTLEVQLYDGSSYTVAYPDQSTVARLLAKHPGVGYSVDGKVRQ